MVIELLAGVLLSLAVGATAMWIREKQDYIRYSEKRIAEALGNEKS